MPSWNTVREDVADNYFHIYSRGANKQPIFIDEQDYQYFESLLARYLSEEPQLGKGNYPYPSYAGKVSLLAYCLMNNHFHLLAYQKEVGALSALMKSLITSYSMYFNLRHKHSGAVFESRFKSSRISTQGYLEHISRYIHLNPRNWQKYKHSSIRYYLGAVSPGWLKEGAIAELFNSPGEYEKFMSDYEENKRMISEIKHELANS